MNEVERLDWIDAMKGVGIILIMMSHTIHIGVLFILYSGFIPLFFISSALTYKSMDIRKRFKRLIIPYFFYCILFIWLSTIMNLPLNDYNVLGVIYGKCKIFKEGMGIPMLPRIVTPLWFLPAMFLSFAFIYFRSKIKDSCKWGVFRLILYSNSNYNGI